MPVSFCQTSWKHLSSRYEWKHNSIFINLYIRSYILKGYLKIGDDWERRWRRLQELFNRSFSIHQAQVFSFIYNSIMWIIYRIHSYWILEWDWQIFCRDGTARRVIIVHQRPCSPMNPEIIGAKIGLIPDRIRNHLTTLNCNPFNHLLLVKSLERGPKIDDLLSGIVIKKLKA